MALRDSMRDSAAAYLRPGETVQAVLGAQTASQREAPLTCMDAGFRGASARVR
jgi:hypothetical protein